MSTPTVSIVIPTRLQQNPNMVDDGFSTDPTLWLDNAVNSVRHQTQYADAHIIIATDPGVRMPIRFEKAKGVTQVSGPDEAPKGQAAAVNRGIVRARGDIIAILEDDDTWEPRKLEAQVAALEQFDLVTSNARETTWNGEWIRMNDFATPSGWVMRRETWERVGPMDETFRYHVDTEWLGRANRLGLKRVHLVEAGASVEMDKRPWLINVQRYSAIAHIGNDRPLVNRVVNLDGGMSKIAAEAEAAAQSRREHEVMVERFGNVPW